MRWIAACLLVFGLGSCVSDDIGSVARGVHDPAVCDTDSDGYDAPSCGGLDCNDNDPDMYPGHGCEIEGGCGFPGCGDPGKQVDAGPEVLGDSER